MDLAEITSRFQLIGIEQNRRQLEKGMDRLRTRIQSRNTGWRNNGLRLAAGALFEVADQGGFAGSSPPEHENNRTMRINRFQRIGYARQGFIAGVGNKIRLRHDAAGHDFARFGFFFLLPEGCFRRASWCGGFWIGRACWRGFLQGIQNKACGGFLFWIALQEAPLAV